MTSQDKKVQKPIKKCFIPQCCNNTISTPSKIFLSVPMDERRKRWFHVAKVLCHANKNTYCCEDHFNLEEDASNWMYYKLMGNRLMLKPHVVPRINRDAQSNAMSDETKKRKADNIKTFEEGAKTKYTAVSRKLLSNEENIQNNIKEEYTEIEIKEEPILDNDINAFQLEQYTDNSSAELGTSRIQYGTNNNKNELKPNIKSEATDEISLVQNFDGECIEFGHYVGIELEKLTDYGSFLIAKQCITSIILAAQNGNYKNGIKSTVINFLNTPAKPGNSINSLSNLVHGADFML